MSITGKRYAYERVRGDGKGQNFWIWSIAKQITHESQSTSFISRRYLCHLFSRSPTKRKVMSKEIYRLEKWKFAEKNNFGMGSEWKSKSDRIRVEEMKLCSKDKSKAYPSIGRLEKYLHAKINCPTEIMQSASTRKVSIQDNRSVCHGKNYFFS